MEESEITHDDNIIKLCCVSAASNYRADSRRFVRHFLSSSEPLAAFGEDIEVMSLRSIPHSHCSVVFVRNKALNVAIISIGAILAPNMMTSMSNLVPVALPSLSATVPGKVMAYVLRIAESFFTSGNGEWVQSIANLLDENTKLIFTGHSLGGSVTMLITLALLANNIKRSQNIECITFGSALFADIELSEFFMANGWANKFLTVINNNDSIPRLQFLADARVEVLAKLNRMFPIADDRPEMVFSEAESYARRDKRNPFSARPPKSTDNNFTSSVPVGKYLFLSSVDVEVMPRVVTQSVEDTIRQLQLITTTVAATAADSNNSNNALGLGLNDHGLIRGYFRTLGISTAPLPLVSDNVQVSVCRNWFSGVDVWMKVWMTIGMDGEHLRAFLRDEVNFYECRMIDLQHVNVNLEGGGQLLCFRSKLNKRLPQQNDCVLKIQIPQHLPRMEWVNHIQELMRYAKQFPSA